MYQRAKGQPRLQAAEDVPALHVTLRGVMIVVVATTAAVVLACIVAATFRLGFGIQHGPLNVIPLFDMYAEATVPAWYTSLLLLVAAALLGVIGWTKLRHRESYARHWIGLGVLFLLLSMDETVSVHERLSWPMRHVLEPQGPYLYAWVIPASIALLVIGIVYLRFLLHLPRRTRWLMVLSACIYVGAALGLEMIEGAHHTRHGNETLTYATLVIIEESMEMVGIAVFAYTLLDYLRGQWGGVTLLLRRPAPQHIVTAVQPEIRLPGLDAWVAARRPDRAAASRRSA